MLGTTATRRLGLAGALLGGGLTLAGALGLGSPWSPVALQGGPLVEPITDADAEANEAALRDRFTKEVAPLLTGRCLDCHNSTEAKGGLDLTAHEPALEGGNGGPAVVPGKPGESLLWEYVAFDLMPAEGPPLTEAEKRVLKRWIEDGAVWADAAIDRDAFRDTEAELPTTWLRRLTVPEYSATIEATFGLEIDKEARALLPPDIRADGFRNTAYNLTVDLGHVEAYARLAAIVASRLEIPAFLDRFTDEAEPLAEAEPKALIAAMGRWILRGPLEEPEADAFLAIWEAAEAEGAEPEEAARLVIEAMLQSPRFLYRIERQVGDGEPRPLDPYELASRVSYILWGAPPDEKLRALAATGELNDPETLQAQVERMLDDPRAVEQSVRFLEDWLDLSRLENLRPNPDHFPTWDDRLAEDMGYETRAYFRDVVWEQERPLSDLLNAQVTYLTPRLADHYGLAWGRWSQALGDDRGTPGLEALFEFAGDASGERLRDASGSEAPITLEIDDSDAVAWSVEGLELQESTRIQSVEPPKALIERLRETNAFTLEAWVTPATFDQDGPARIVSLSSGTGQRNLTLGQENRRYDVRCRTTETDRNGLPSVSSPSGSLALRLTHVAFTWDGDSGWAWLYLDGRPISSRKLEGDLSNWDTGFRLVLGNETSGDRPWRGTLHRVALFSRAMEPEELKARGLGPFRIDLADEPTRGGLLTQGSLLTIGGDEASTVTRGLFVLHDLLGGEVGDPPPGVDTTPVPPEPGLSKRAIAENRIANPACGGCHSKFEPFAFGLEKYDGLGAYQDIDEHGNTLRDGGELLFPGRTKPVAFDSSEQLMELLADSERVRRTITRKLAQFALGRPLTKADTPALKAIHERGWEDGGTYKSLMTQIVTSDLVTTTRTEPTQ